MQLKLRTRTVVAAAIALLVLAAGTAALTLRHHNTVTPNNTPPTTGVSLIFDPPLQYPADLAIDNANGETIKHVVLARGSVKGSTDYIANPTGSIYNVPLAEGVYRLKISGGDKAFPLFTETVTVTAHKLTTQRVSFAAYPR